MNTPATTPAPLSTTLPPSPPPPTPPSPLSRILVLLRVTLHVCFAFFLGFAVITTAVDSNPHLPAVTIVAALLSAIYLTGTTWEKRAIAHADSPATFRPHRLSLLWLGTVTLLWTLLVAYSAAFVWLLFPLSFLILHLLARPANLIALLIGWAVAAFLPLVITSDQWTVTAAIAPGIGCVLATAVYFTYQALSREIDSYAQLARELLATHEELVDTEHQAGRLEERERLSREIHDTVAQGLSSIVLLSRAANSNLANGDTERVATQLATIHEQAQASLSEARRFVRDLASPDLSDPLPAALRRVVDRAGSRDAALGITRDYHLEILGELDRPVPEPVARTIIRVVQEGLNNIHKHSNATKAVVTLGIWEEDISIDIVDNGELPDHPAPTLGYGLRGLRSRVDNLGGTFAVEFGTHAGTSVALTSRIPLTSRRDES